MSQYTSLPVTNQKKIWMRHSFKVNKEINVTKGSELAVVATQKGHTSNSGFMVTYALGSWNASLNLDPAKQIRKKN